MLKFKIFLLCSVFIASAFTKTTNIEKHLFELKATLSTFEYIFERNGTGNCEFVVAKPLVRHRGLKFQTDVIVNMRPLAHTMPSDRKVERNVDLLVHIYGQDPGRIWRRALEVCNSAIGTTKYQELSKSESLPPTFLVQEIGRMSFEDPPIPEPIPKLPIPPPPPPPLTTFPIVMSGYSWNRVDLVIFSDGYTATEEDKFVADAQRLALDLVTNDTLATVSPLINIWGAFSPSQESGIGTNGVPKDTVFGLYRDGTELRGVYSSKPVAGITACLSMASSCDFPILLGNDPLYGGLGGMFTITTSSIENGALVLRHELGHSIIPVGEEYDGGFAYFGVNAQDKVDADIKWKHWIPNENSLREERSVMPLQGYPWSLLKHDNNYTVPFNSSGTYSRHLVRFSLSGFRSKHELKVTLDGKDLDWEPKEGLGVDRWHYNIYRNFALTEGVHVLGFALQDSGDESIAQLCSYEILEFGDEDQFNTTSGNIGAYPTFSLQNETTYRPTNEDCLMRIVTTQNFCAPCKEGLWSSLLTRTSYLDALSFGCREPDEDVDEYYLWWEVGLLPLGQFRSESLDDSERYSIQWSFNGIPLPQFDNSTTIIVPDSQLSEDDYSFYSLNITLRTPEVRHDPLGLLSSQYSWSMSPGKCKKDIGDIVEFVELPSQT